MSFGGWARWEGGVSRCLDSGELQQRERGEGIEGEERSMGRCRDCVLRAPLRLFYACVSVTCVGRGYAIARRWSGVAGALFFFFLSCLVLACLPLSLFLRPLAALPSAPVRLPGSGSAGLVAPLTTRLAGETPVQWHRLSSSRPHTQEGGWFAEAAEALSWPAVALAPWLTRTSTLARAKWVTRVTASTLPPRAYAHNPSA